MTSWKSPLGTPGYITWSEDVLLEGDYDKNLWFVIVDHAGKTLGKTSVPATDGHVSPNIVVDDTSLVLEAVLVMCAEERTTLDPFAICAAIRCRAMKPDAERWWFDVFVMGLCFGVWSTSS